MNNLRTIADTFRINNNLPALEQHSAILSFAMINVLTGVVAVFVNSSGILCKADGTPYSTGNSFISPVISTGLTATGSASNNFSGSTGAFQTSTGAVSLNGAVTVNAATTPSITTATGKTNTGFLTILGKTSGGFKITTADATAQTVTATLAAQTVGAAALTIPDFAGVADTFAFITLAQTLSNKTLASPIFTTRQQLPYVNTAVAAAGSSNSDAAALTSASLQHVSSDSAAKGVKLPVGVAGLKITIINDSSTALKLYPEASGNVNGQTTTSGSVTILASKGVLVTCTVALTWIVFDLAAKSS